MAQSLGYLGELRHNVRPLAGATAGVAFGVAVVPYFSSILSPHVIAEFGWTQAQFALLGMAAVAALIANPIVGRLSDLFGVRRVATIGAVGVPGIFWATSYVDGAFTTFLILMTALVGIGTACSAVVYTRVIAERFFRARGIAYTLVMCGPAVAGAIGAPLLNAFIEDHGWRVGFRVLAVVLFFMSLAAISLLPGSTPPRAAEPRRSLPPPYRRILTTPAFWMIAGGMFLCNIPATLHTSQMTLLLLDNGQTRATASFLVSTYAVATIVGRLVCGVALDKFAPRWVAALSLGAPAIGFLLLASSLDARVVVASAVALMGLSEGAEGDLVGFLVARYFPVEIYGSVIGLVAASLAAAAVFGSLLLSLTLHWTGSFASFLTITAGTILIGSLVILGLKRAEGRSPNQTGAPHVLGQSADADV